MKENKGFIVACCLLWIITPFMFWLGDSDAGFIFALFIFPASVISWLALLIIALYRVYKQYYLSWQKQDYISWQNQLVPFYFLFVPLIILYTIGTVSAEADKKRTWLVINSYDFSGSDNFKFYKDGEYTSWRDSPLGSSQKKSGRFERRDSILILHPEAENGVSQEVRLAIRPYSEFKKQQSNPMITLVSLDTTVGHYQPAP